MPHAPNFVNAMLAAGLALLAACGGGGGDAPAPPVTPPAPGLTDNTAYSAAPNASLASATEAAAVTRHAITLAGASLAYTATAGHLTANHPISGAAQASMFYVAYTADGAPAASRPVVFFYNGGPGSASVWLHLGSFGPRRVVTHVPSTTITAPFELVDNADSLLASADLVFVDAVGTGFSQAITPNTNQSFWGVDADAALMRDFIARYAAVNGRAASPTFLFGESYGSTRSGVLANLMVAAGQRLDGVILLSSILDYNANCDVLGPAQVSCEGFIPTYGETGAWFALVTPPPAADDVYGDSFAAGLRDFSSALYGPAVDALLASGALPTPPLVADTAARTGAPLALWQANFNLTPGAYRAGLLTDQLIGRYDGRVIAATGSALAAEGDPSSTLITAPFVAAQRAHLANELLYRNGSTYTVLGNAISTWNFGHDGRALPDVVPDLATALAQRPGLRVLSLNGYHDLATPFFQTEIDLARLGAAPNVRTRFYPGGHMIYLDDRSRPRVKADVAAFIAEAP